VFAGVAYETVDNSAGSAGDKSIRVETDGVFSFLTSGAAQANVGSEIYWDGAIDSSTVTLTNSVIVENCEDAWTQSANVTDADEATIKKVGTNSRKLTIDTLFGTGLVAYEDFTAADLSSYTHIAVWVRANGNVAGDVLGIVIDEHSACVSPSETLNFPALTANTWHRFVLPFTEAGTTRNATISVGITALSDPGAVILYVDDIQVVKLGAKVGRITEVVSATEVRVRVDDYALVQVNQSGTE
jgi:hypothetical protein